MAKLIDLDEQEFVLEKLFELPLDKVKQHSNKINFRCPVCGDSSKSTIKSRGWYYKNTNSYFCFNCNVSASGIGVISTLSNSNYADIASEYMQWKIKNKRNIQSNKQNISKIKIEKQIDPIKFEIKDTWVNLPPPILDYVNKRQILQASYKPSWFTLYYNTATKRIVIPWYNKLGKLIYYQERAISNKQNPKYLFPKDSDKPIFAIDNIDIEKQYVFYTEGVFDCIFVENCIAVGGINFTESQSIELEKRGILNKLVWIPDNPYVDESAKTEIIKVCQKNPSIKIYEWDKNNHAKDINESIIQYHKNEFSINSPSNKLISIDKMVIKLQLS